MRALAANMGVYRQQDKKTRCNGTQRLWRMQTWTLPRVNRIDLEEATALAASACERLFLAARMCLKSWALTPTQPPGLGGVGGSSSAPCFAAPDS
jgi:hypothetical protein